MKKIESYFKAHVYYNSLTHLLIGAGLGVLLTYPIVGVHPLRWGIGLVLLGSLGHLYPLMKSK